MKLRFLKSVLSFGAMALAIAGAFAADVKTETTELPPVTGWASLPGETPCDEEVACQTEDGPICRILHNGVFYQAFPKVSGVCTTTRLNMRN